jgi:hypothetical protein
MMVLAHTQKHWSMTEEAVADAVYLRADCDSSNGSPLFALIPENDTEPGP